MSKTRVLFLGLAVVAALLAAFLVKGLVKPAPRVVAQPTQSPASAPKVVLSQILVMKKNLALGQPITRDAIGWQEWPKSSVRKGMMTKAASADARDKLIGARARVQLFEGDPVNAKKVVQAGERGFMAAILPKGFRAISVRISAATGAGGFILPNDRVDVLVTRKQTYSGTSEAVTVSELVLSNVKVLAIDQTLNQNKEGEQVVVGKTATLEMTPKQAEVLAKVETSGQLTLTLRSFADIGSKKLGDAGPKLAPQYAKGSTGNEIKVFRYGVKSLSAASK